MAIKIKKPMITKIQTQDYSSSQTLFVDADKETVAKILAFIAELNKQHQTTNKEVIAGPPSVKIHGS